MALAEQDLRLAKIERRTTDSPRRAKEWKTRPVSAGDWLARFEAPLAAGTFAISANLHPLLYDRQIAAGRRILARAFRESRSERTNSELEARIDEAKQMLEWGEDWDGEGAAAYEEATLERAAAYLRELSDSYSRRIGKTLPLPKILAGPAGSVDILWKLRTAELLINIPAGPDEACTLYGDNVHGREVRGPVDLDTPDLALILWIASDA